MMPTHQTSRPTTPIATPEELDPSEIQECMICLEPVDGKSNIFVTECHHTFHASCMVRQLRHSSNCPVCRHKLGPSPVKKLELNEEIVESLIQTTFNSPINRDQYFGGHTGLAAYHYTTLEHLLPESYRHPPWNNLASGVRNAQANIMDNILMRFGTTLCQYVGDWINYESTEPDEEAEEAEEAESQTLENHNRNSNLNDLPLPPNSDSESDFQESQEMWIPESQLVATLDAEVDANIPPVEYENGIQTPPLAASPVAPPPVLRPANSSQQQERLIQNMMDILFNAQNPTSNSRALLDALDESQTATSNFPHFTR
jgi:hypothetical protein